MTPLTKSRIESIDVVRGIAMVIMALDHVRDFFHAEAFTDDPLNLATTTPLLFFTRWITHFCAPIFVFLSGTSIYLQSLRKTKKELSAFLVKRGLWLIFVEFIIITFSWTFNPAYSSIFLQVIWAIGISMVILGLLIRLPYKIILSLGLLIVFGHNLLDIPEAAPDFKTGFWDLIHHGNWSPYELLPNHTFVIIYPFLAWTGVMMLGYCMGIFYTSKFTAENRQKTIFRIGIGLILLFVILRFINIYGAPHPWTTQKNSLYTFLSFLKIHKYPPSLLYLCITIGPALLLLSMVERIKNHLTNILVVFGRTAFFYYVIHFFPLAFTFSCFILYTWQYYSAGNRVIAKLPFLLQFPDKDSVWPKSMAFGQE
ncbi:MAG: DUF1624 domain-containing protein [Bacteroidetes bacterium]|nr:DUF1624 domain-containing protein [Bacteroidota bacterium]